MKILAIDGGGIRGIYSAHILNRIEQEFAIRFYKSFDLITGTSTGAIIAAALAIDYPISDIVNLYEKNGKRIFKKQIFGFLGFLKSRYDNQNLKVYLDQVFKEKTMSDTLTRLVIPATDIGNGQVFVTKSQYLDEFVRDKDIKISDAVLASCAAPTYFNPVVIKDYLLADGGLWANNPALSAYVEATGKLKISKDNIKILSIGTGIGNKYYSHKSFNRKWRKLTGFFGINFYGIELINVLLNLQSKSAQNMLNLLLDKEQYLRLNFDSDSKLSLDDVATIGDLKSRADHEFTYYFNKIKDFFEK